MNFSYNWISELVPGLAVDAKELGRLITMKTAECEDVTEVGAHLPKVCAARVLTVEPIDGSHNVKAVLDAGRGGRKTVVCGAPNCRPGVTAAYVPAGVVLAGREIGKTVLHGIESEGMLASAAELGIGREAGGLLELEAEPGAPLTGCVPDSIIEIDNKSITHRPDLWGHFGLAREAAAITRQTLRDPVRTDLLPAGPAAIQVAVEDPVLCPRYSALVFENVTVKPSPPWLQYRLESLGLNPINNIVDVTNLVMTELAQPLHAFDRDLLRGETIFVKRAPAGAVFVGLNEQSYTLDRDCLVIADAGGPIALAGVIGGMDSAINQRTTRIVLESACFSGSNIRKTSMRLKLRTDASMRFEKSQDPENTVRGLARALELFEQVSPGIRLVGGVADQRTKAPAPAPIELRLDWLKKKLGRELPAAEVRDILERLCFGVAEPAPGVFLVTVPSWRATKDVSIKDDLVEEVGRMVGYDSITPLPPLVPVTVPPSSSERLFHRHARATFAAQGFTEVYNYSFLSEEQARDLGFDPAAHLAVANPIASDQSLMRLSLIPEIAKNIRENSKHFETFRLFEIGREIHKQPAGLPREITRLVAAMYRKEDGETNLYELKRAAECLMPGCAVRPAAARSFEHPARAAEVTWKGDAVGRLFELHPSLAGGRAAILDLDLEQVRRLHEAAGKRYRSIRRYPTSAFDLSVIADPRDLAGEIENKLRGFAGEALETIEFLRRYSGPPIPEGKQSVSFRLTVGAPDRTLSLEEAGAIRATIIEGMNRLGYELRV